MKFFYHWLHWKLSFWQLPVSSKSFPFQWMIYPRTYNAIIPACEWPSVLQPFYRRYGVTLGCTAHLHGFSNDPVDDLGHHVAFPGRRTFCREEGNEKIEYPWWRHQMEAFSALLAICAGNSPVPGEFPTQRPVTRSFDVFFDLRLNKRLSKQSWSWWLETLSRPLWRHRNDEWNIMASKDFNQLCLVQLVQVKTCCLIGTKPLPEQLLNNRRLWSHLRKRAVF